MADGEGEEEDTFRPKSKDLGWVDDRFSTICGSIR